MGSVILGGGLIFLGVLSYLVGLATFVWDRFRPAPVVTRTVGNDMKAIAEVLKELAAVIEKFSKLSVNVQWAVLGLLSIAGGAYLLANKPF